MAVFFYNVFVFAYGVSARFLALFGHKKARFWVEGRKIPFRKIAGNDPIWFHCASLGEFEQIRALIQQVKAEKPEIPVLLTFFSPSGYEIQKNYAQADVVMYLPEDKKSRVQHFLDFYHPQRIIFNRSELWYHFLKTAQERNIPTYLTAAVYTPENWLFTWKGKMYHPIVEGFEIIFVADTESGELIRKIRKGPVVLGGDTRIDRTLHLPSEPLKPEWIADWAANDKPVFLASMWEKDIEMVKSWMLATSERIILVPHEIHPQQIKTWASWFGEDVHIFSNGPASRKTRVLILDAIGILNKLYRLGKWAYIGGGFGHGTHSTLEPTVYGLPVIFGPEHTRYPEDVHWVKTGVGFSIRTPEEFRQAVSRVEELNPEAVRETIQAFYRQESGATGRIMQGIFHS